MSQKIGLAPVKRIAFAQEENVKLGRITSCPRFKSRAHASSSAAVPEPVGRTYGASSFLEISLASASEKARSPMPVPCLIAEMAALSSSLPQNVLCKGIRNL